MITIRPDITLQLIQLLLLVGGAGMFMQRILSRVDAVSSQINSFQEQMKALELRLTILENGGRRNRAKRADSA